MFEDIYKPEKPDKTKIGMALKTCGNCCRLYVLPEDCMTDNRYCPVHRIYVSENSSGCTDGKFKDKG
ncbi:hypothetical protein KAR91_73715 [Candidatus Pacearchaeota archaeon]|nr:hypothetical protein [Candidatus Pacearchaeota archaeon]